MTTASAALAVKDALVALTQTAVGAAVPVFFGHPGFGYLPDDVCSVGDVQATTQAGPMSPSRRRDEALRVALVVSCYRGGGPDVQRVATAAAYALLSAVHAAIQADPTLGGVCRDAALVEHRLAEADDPDLMAEGRIAEISAVVEVQARI